MALKCLFVSLIIVFSILHVTYGSGGTVQREAVVTYAVNQYTKLLTNFTVGRYITETSPLNSVWPTVGPDGMKAGYLPGILWNLYRYTGDSYWRQVATDFIDPLANLTTFTNMENYAVSFGTAYDITGNASYANTIIRAADTIIRDKYNASLGFIVEGSGETRMGDTYNLIELECIVRAWNLTKNQSYHDIAVTVLDNALNVFVRRNNYTTFSAVLFNITNGGIIEIFTANSPYRSWGWWSRGHMWLIAGVVDVYRVTRNQTYLLEAEKLAEVYLNNLPEDYITYNEFYTAQLPGYNVRDTTSASIAAAYFPEIAAYTANSTLRDRLLSTSASIMQSLWSDKYRADGNPSYRLPAFLANATHNIPVQQDYSFSIADYYFSKAIQYAANTSARQYINLSLLFLLITAVDYFYYQY